MADWRERRDRMIADRLMETPSGRKAVGDQTSQKIAALLGLVAGLALVGFLMANIPGGTSTRTGRESQARSTASSVIDDFLDDALGDAPVIARADADEAQDVVQRFVDHLRAGEMDAAAALWTGYPGDPAVRSDGVVAFAAEYDWLVSTPSYKTAVTPGFGWSHPVPVVTVVSRNPADEIPHVVAFVVDRGRDSGAMEIRRLPSGETTAEPPAGSAVSAGQTITVAAQPVEGGVTVHFDGIEVPAARESPDFGSITFEVPDTALGTAILAISVATPEELYATALVYEVV